MAAHTGQPTRSRRFIKIYLSVWALLAVGAVAYLAMLALPPQAGLPPHAVLDPPRSGPGESKTLAEVRSMRGAISEIRKDVTELQEAVGERVANEKVVQTRLTALEERVSTVDGAQHGSALMPEGKDKAAHKASEPRPSAEAHDVPPLVAVGPPATPIETGSIGSRAAPAPKAEIVFGEPIVTPAAQSEFAVQLAAGASLQAMRQSWGRLAERHAGALGKLQPRVVAPRAEGGSYRLLAGPVATKADAERICTALGIGPKACFPTPYVGAPL